MKAKTFVIKKIAVMKDKRSYSVSFELEGCEWSNFFELAMKKDDTPEIIQEKIVARVKLMVEAKDMENELMRTITNKDIPLGDAGLTPAEIEKVRKNAKSNS